MMRAARTFLSEHGTAVALAVLKYLAILAGLLALLSLWVSHGLGSATWQVVRRMAADEQAFVWGVVLVGMVYLILRLMRSAILPRTRPVVRVSSSAARGAAAWAGAPAGRDDALNPHHALEVRARHEAVHAIAIQSLGWHVDKVSTRRGWKNGPTGGNCEFSTPEPVVPLADMFYDRIVFTLAPHVDDAMRQFSSTGASSDLAAVWEDSFKLQSLDVVPRRMRRHGATAEDLTFEGITRHARGEVREILAAHADDIEALAARLQISPEGVTINGADLPPLHR